MKYKHEIDSKRSNFRFEFISCFYFNFSNWNFCFLAKLFELSVNRN